MAESRPGHELQDSPKTPEQKGISIEMALRETVKAIFPITTRIYQKEDWRFRYDEELGYPYPDIGPKGLGKDEPSNIIYGLAGDIPRTVAATFMPDALSGIKLAVAMGLLLSPNLVHLASKNRLIREAGKTVGRGIAKGAAAALRYVPPR